MASEQPYRRHRPNASVCDVRQRGAMDDKKNSTGFWSGIRLALCTDLPFILDSAWRRREFEANRLFDYDLAPDGSQATLKRRADRRLPVFWMFIATLVFFAYGATFDALCSVFGASGMRVFRIAFGVFMGLLAVRQALRWWDGGRARASKRIAKEQLNGTWRARFIYCGVAIGVLALVVPLVLLGAYHVKHAADTGCLAVNPAPAWLQLAVVVAAVAVTVLLGGRRVSSWRRTLEQTAVLAIAGGLLLLIAPENASEAQQGPYPHVYGVLALALAAIACVAPWIARKQFRALSAADQQAFRDSLRNVELFPAPRKDSDVSWRRAWRALRLGAASHPLQLLFLPALVVLMVPTQWMWGWGASALALAALLLMVGNLSNRWQQMVQYVRRWFLVGTPLAVSVFVIGMAILRLAQVQYVSTVLDAAPFGAIFVWIAMAYALFWWFEYSVNSAASIALLGVLGTAEQARNQLVPYPIDPRYAGAVKPTDRYIAPHGAGRFAIMGWFWHAEKKCAESAFHTYELLALFRRLMPANATDAFGDLNRRVQLYFLKINSLVAIGALAYLLYYGHGDAANTVAPVVTVNRAGNETQYADLAKLLAEQARKNRPAIVVAASGGGTRAALFTASALEGLAKLHRAEDIVLLSGVSGGGVASAYFFSHREQLLDPARTDAWETYKNRIAEPFIRDVLDGAGEWRVVSAEPLGNLLAESFERRLFADGLTRIGDAARPALILNTTITGHPQEHSMVLRGMFAKSDAKSCDRLHRPYSFLSGGRLIFTNLNSDTAFPSDVSLLVDVRLPYVVARDPNVPLSRAAALNANFPPVFPNARVNVAVDDAECPTRPYYVTDGGATENLGLASALFALREALRALPREQRPAVHIVAIEASATGYDYSQDRGIGAAAGGAKERLIGALTEELLNDLCASLDAGACRSQLPLHYISMPLAFRSRGGFGTHWMFPNAIQVENPRLAALPSGWQALANRLTGGPRSHVAIDRTDLVEMWTALHAPDASFCQTPFTKPERQTLQAWICGDESLPPDLHINQWRQLVESLKVTN